MNAFIGRSHLFRGMVCVAGIGLLFVVDSCKDNPSSPEEEVYLEYPLLNPMTIGDHVTYYEERRSAVGVVETVRTFGPFLITDSLPRPDACKRTEYLDWSWYGWLWEDNAGLWMRHNAPLDTLPYMRWKWPCKVGDVYQTYLTEFAMSVTCSVESISAIISTPIRTDTCVVYVFRSGGLIVEKEYFAPGFGWMVDELYCTNSPAFDWGSALLPITSYPKWRNTLAGVLRQDTTTTKRVRVR